MYVNKHNLAVYAVSFKKAVNKMSEFKKFRKVTYCILECMNVYEIVLKTAGRKERVVL